MLSENDLKVLKAILQGHTDPKGVARDLNIKVEAARAAADALGEQGLIRVSKSVEEVIALTEEGRAYAEKGLPERVMLSAIGQGMAISELRDPAQKIGLGWLRKKGWAAIDNGMIQPMGRNP
mgnify:FL=1